MNRSVIAAVGLALFAAGGCNAQGCSCLAPLPFGFPSSARVPNATQMRVSQSGVAALQAEPAVVAAELLGGSLSLEVTSSCGGSSPTCCPGGTPVSPCGPIVVDVTAQVGDLPRLVITPAQGASRVDVTLRARLATATDVPVTVPLVGDCLIHVDTRPGPTQDVRVDVPLNLVQDATAATTRLEVGSVTLSGLTSDDVSLAGSFSCQIASLGLSFFLGVLTDTLADALKTSLQSKTCKPCPGGTTAECGPLADACTSGTCMIGNVCLQELGATGRLASAALFGGAPPGSTGTLDLYEVAGGYATTNSSGVALGALAGMLPSGAERDRCGPAATAPAPVTVPQSAYFQGNSRPDTGAAFGLAVGMHSSEVSQLAYAAYEGGLLCTTVDTNALPTLTTDSLAAYVPSLSNLTGGNRPVAVGLRPQAPPTFTLGANTFDTNRAVVDPLVDLTFSGMEIDLFANVEDQPLRVLTLVGDVAVPLGMDIDGTGKLVPTLGPSAGAASVTTKSSEPLQETGTALESLGPVLLDAALPELVGRTGPITLPRFIGMDVGPTAVTSVDGQAFVALFADLKAPAGAGLPAGRIQDTARPDGIPMLRPPALPEITLGRRATDLRVIAALLAALGLLVATRRRARRWIAPAAAAVVAVGLPVACGDGTGSSKSAPDAGSDDDQAASGGSTGSGGAGGGPAASGGALGQSGGSGGLGGTTGNGGAKASGGATGDASTSGGTSGGDASTSGGTSGGDASTSGGAGGQSGGTGGTGGGSGTGGAGGNPCGATACLPGDVPHGALGQWNSVDVGGRTVITSYDALLGDVVLVELSGSTETRRVIDGVPNVTPTHDPSGYRGGIAEAGPDVGAWTSVRLAGTRVAVAYQDRDRGALRAAFEDTNGVYHPHDVDDSATSGVEIGAYASLALGTTPAIAYIATGVPGANGTHSTELRLATASTASPTTQADWTTTVVASAASEPPALLDIPGGPGAFVNLLALADGRRVLVHHDRSRRALLAHVESGAGTRTFAETVLDGGGTLDRGRWVSAVADGTGLVHVAYEDEIEHQVFYLTFTPGGAPSTPEVVDDGTRSGDRPHWVGAGLALWLDGGPRVAYQDAATANVVVATKSGSWSHVDRTSGAALDGFHLAAPPSGPGPLVWDQMSSVAPASHQLVVLQAP